MKQTNTLYFDYAATTPLSDSVKKAVTEMLDNYYNPSSIYQSGRDVKADMEDARYNVAKFINANIDDIYFTSSGSASNTLAIKGYLKDNMQPVFYSPIAHKSIIKCVEDLKNPIYKIPVNKYGEFNLDELEEMLSKSKNPFVIMDYANSEIGTKQYVKKIASIVHKYNGVIYVDCTGSISTIQLDVKELNIDMAGFSAHKLGALKGCGVLYKTPDIKLNPLIYGSQEGGLFGGTENVLGIVALGTAVKEYDYTTLSSHSQEYVIDYLVRHVPNFYLIGSPRNRLINNLCLCINGIKGENLMALMDMNGVQISTGSACNNYSPEPSNALKEIGVKEKDLYSCIRITFSCRETDEQLGRLCIQLVQNIYNLRKFT